MALCTLCGNEGSLADFEYVSQAHEAGCATMRRCPACGELALVDELDEMDSGSAKRRPWGLAALWGTALRGKEKGGRDG